jgi:hypothetical protein
MTRRAAFLTILSAYSLLVAGPGHATSSYAAALHRIEAAPQPPTDPRTVSISGTVRGADGQPRPGVSVFPSNNPRLLAVTDAKGAFSLQLPATAGTFRLQADYFGLGNSRFEVDGEHPQPVNIVLGQ